MRSGLAHREIKCIPFTLRSRSCHSIDHRTAMHSEQPSIGHWIPKLLSQSVASIHQKGIDYCSSHSISSGAKTQTHDCCFAVFQPYTTAIVRHSNDELPSSECKTMWRLRDNG